LGYLDALAGIVAIDPPRRKEGAQLVEAYFAFAEVDEVEVEFLDGHVAITLARLPGRRCSMHRLTDGIEHVGDLAVNSTPQSAH